VTPPTWGRRWSCRDSRSRGPTTFAGRSSATTDINIITILFLTIMD
jgi:hypothetical protein